MPQARTENTRINVGDKSVGGIWNLPAKPVAVYVYAHGAGAAMNHSFMSALAASLADLDIAVLRYNFLYMEEKKKRPDVPAVAHAAVAAAVDAARERFPDLPLFAGGKSFGGRMTSQWASKAQPALSGLVFVGFPLHPAGQPSVARAEHLQLVKQPMLFLQGTRDALAEADLLRGVCAALKGATINWWEGADHSFKMKGKDAIPELACATRTWVDTLLSSSGPPRRK